MKNPHSSEIFGPPNPLLLSWIPDATPAARPVMHPHT